MAVHGAGHGTAPGMFWRARSNKLVVLADVAVLVKLWV